jgi:hypothetical protein
MVMPVKSTLCLTRIFASVVFVCFFGACAAGNNIKISDRDLFALKSISIDPAVEVPELPWVHGLNTKALAASFFGGLGGGIGEVIGSKEAGKMLKAYLNQHKINISEIVLKSFKEKIKQNKLFEIQDNSSVKLKLKIINYGFVRAGAFDYGNAEPKVAITAALISDETNIMWRKYDYSGSPDLKVYQFQELLKEPDLVAESLSEASDNVADKLLSGLESASPNP